MKTAYKAIAFIAMAACLAACKKGETAGEPRSISLSSLVHEDNGATRADGATFNRTLQPLFLFWTEDNFNDATKSAPDFFVRTPDGEIDDYQTEKYNTGVYYPLYDKVVYAAGLAPAPGEGGLQFVTEGDYSQFNIPVGPSTYGDDAHGAYDVMTTTKVQGNDTNPIAEPLLFKHALTKLSFDAILAESMPQFVKFITIEFPGSAAALSVEWDETDETYKVTGGTDGTDDFVFGNYWTLDGSSLIEGDPRANYTMFYQLNKTRAQRVGITYIVPPHASSIPVTVKYKMVGTVGGFDTPDPLYPIRDEEKDILLNFVDNNGDPISLEAGDSYSIRLVFNIYDIELIGKLRDWKDGGYISLPFQPTR